MYRFVKAKLADIKITLFTGAAGKRNVKMIEQRHTEMDGQLTFSLIILVFLIFIKFNIFACYSIFTLQPLIILLPLIYPPINIFTPNFFIKFYREI